MTPPAFNPLPGEPDTPGDADAIYSLDVLAHVSGVATETILLYHERGLLRARPGEPDGPCFDDEAVRRLRRLESVRESGAMNMAGVCLVARLLDQIEELEAELRRRS